MGAFNFTALTLVPDCMTTGMDLVYLIKCVVSYTASKLNAPRCLTCNMELNKVGGALKSTDLNCTSYLTTEIIQTESQGSQRLIGYRRDI